MDKVCSRCKKSKSVAQFYRSKSSADGYNYYCKECAKAYSKNRRENDPAYRVSKAAAERRWRARNYVKLSSKFGGPKRKYKDRVLARVTAYEKYGSAKQYKCVRCNAQAQEWHHWSYASQHWTSVIPVCKKCHTMHHCKLLHVPLSVADIKLIPYD